MHQIQHMLGFLGPDLESTNRHALIVTAQRIIDEDAPEGISLTDVFIHATGENRKEAYRRFAPFLIRVYVENGWPTEEEQNSRTDEELSDLLIERGLARHLGD